MFRNIAIIALGLLIITNSFAGKEDWKGEFTINDAPESTNKVTHTPSSVSYLCFYTKECIHFSKGCTVNGVIFKEDVNLCRDSNITTFSNEVAKLGKILDKSITKGPSYVE